MSKKADLRKEVETWAKRIGERPAQAKLIRENISPNAAQKLTNGKYNHKPSPLMINAIIKAMESRDERAS